MRIGDRAIDALRTPLATLIVLATALVAQLPHAADVFRLVVHGDGIWATMHGYSYAVALELAVLLFVVQRRNIESYLFAGVSVCVNLAYYALHGVALFSVAALPAWLISVALPAAIARYSHLIVDAAQHDAGAVQRTDVAESAANVAVQQPAAPAQRTDALDAVRIVMQDDAPVAPVADLRAQALQMHAEGMSATQIARALQANVNTVRSWLRRS